jgi:hypothetical protein
MSGASRVELQRARDELKKAEQAMAAHKRNIQAGGAEWRGTWDNGHWCGHNSTELNRIYTNLYNKVQAATHKIEQALYKVDPYRRDLDSTIDRMKEQRKTAGCKAHFNSLFDQLVVVIQRKMDYKANAGPYEESLCICTHYFQGRIVPCDCIADELGFLSLSDANEERLKNKRVCFVGDQHNYTGPNWGKPVRGPMKPGKGRLHIERKWVKEGKNLFQRCEHYHQRPSGWIHEPRDMVPCDCIKRDGLLDVNPENLWVKNAYYRIDSKLPITISRQYKITGVSHQGSDTLGFECNHYTYIEGCPPSEFSEQCDCQATGELSEKLKKFDSRGLVEKRFYGKKLNAMSKITISRETCGLIPHPQGHSCRHERADGGSMECDCIPLFNKYDVEKIEDVVYELSDDMKKRHAAGRVILADDGKLQIGGFFKYVFFPSSSLGSNTHTQKATPYDDDKYVV